MACAILGMEAFITFEKESVRIFGVNMVKQIQCFISWCKKVRAKKKKKIDKKKKKKKKIAYLEL